MPPDSAGLARGEPLVFTFAGREAHALPGQTVAAALMAGGIRSWRTTRINGSPRGIFCGIGVCFDCLVVLNGRPNVRACVELIRPGDRVEPQIGTGRDEQPR